MNPPQSNYLFTNYSAEWPRQYHETSAILRAILGDNLVTVHHIGSTAVPGLAAKPIIDLLPVVADLKPVDDSTAAFLAAGFRAWGEYGLPGRRYFTKDQNQLRICNIHLYQRDDPAIDRHLAFCEYLKVHAEARQAYEQLKREAYRLFPADIQAYNDHKNAWIKSLEPIALEWYFRRLGPKGQS